MTYVTNIQLPPDEKTAAFVPENKVLNINYLGWDIVTLQLADRVADEAKLMYIDGAAFCAMHQNVEVCTVCYNTQIPEDADIEHTDGMYTIAESEVSAALINVANAIQIMTHMREDKLRENPKEPLTKTEQRIKNM